MSEEMPQNKGRGAGKKNLSAEEKRFIEDHFDKDGWTDQKIGEKLGRNAETIGRYRKKNLLSKKFNNNKSVETIINNDGEVLIKDAKETSKINFWKAHFRNTHRYKTLKSKLLVEDMEFFLEKWAMYHIQFEDMTATEEDNIEQLILLELRMKDNLKARKTSQEYEIELERQIHMLGTPNLDLEIEQQRRLRETMLSNNKIQMELNKEYREMVDRYDKIMRSMNATREQREARHQVGGDTFFSLVRILSDKDERIKIAKYNELMRQSGEKKLQEFKKPHIFADNGIEPIIMIGKDYVKKEQDEPQKDSTNNGN